MVISAPEAILIGRAVVKLGQEGLEAYCEAMKEKAEPITVADIQQLIDDHRSTEEILAAHGIERK